MISFRALTGAALVVVLAGFVGVIVDYAITHARLPPQHECRVWTESAVTRRTLGWSERARSSLTSASGRGSTPSPCSQELWG